MTIRSYSTRPKRGPIEALAVSSVNNCDVDCIPRVLSVAPLKLQIGTKSRPRAITYSTRPKRGPIEARLPRNCQPARFLYSTRPKRGPIEAVALNLISYSKPESYSTRPKRGPIEALPPSSVLTRRQCIPRVLSVAPLKRRPDPVFIC